MTRGINKVILIGHLGADPDMNTTNGGSPVSNVSLATSHAWNTKQGEQKEKTEWHRVVFYGNLAEVVHKYLQKGSKIYLEGRIDTNKFTDKQGVVKYSQQIIANQMQMLDSKSETYGAAKREAPAPNGNVAEPKAEQADFSDDDENWDDIPF